MVSELRKNTVSRTTVSRVHICRFIIFHTIGYYGENRSNLVAFITSLPRIVLCPSSRTAVFFTNIRCLYVRVCVSIPAFSNPIWQKQLFWVFDSMHGAENKHGAIIYIHDNLTGQEVVYGINTLWEYWLFTFYIFTELELWQLRRTFQWFDSIYAWVLYKWLEIWVSIRLKYILK
jgi:hypothetical protein